MNYWVSQSKRYNVGIERDEEIAKEFQNGNKSYN